MCPHKKTVLLAALLTPLAASAAEQPPSTATPVGEDDIVLPGPALPGDYNNNCLVDFADVSYVLSQFAPRGDFGMHEIEIILINFGRHCGEDPGDKTPASGAEDSATVQD